MRWWIWLGLAACGGPVDDDAPDDTDGSTPPDPITAVMLFGEFGGGGGLAAAVTSELETVATDDEGLVEIDIPRDGPFVLRMVAPGYPDVLVHGTAADIGFFMSIAVPSSGAIPLLADALGTTIDFDTGGIVAVGVVQATEDLPEPFPGVQVAIDAPFTDALSGDQGAPNNLTFSDVTIGPDDTFVDFTDVPPGEVTVTVTPPAGVVCEAFPSHPGASESYTVSVEAGVLTVVRFGCREL